MISPYARRIITTTAGASLFIGLLLATAIWFPIYRGAELSKEAIVEQWTEDYAAIYDMFSTEVMYSTELEGIISTMHEEYRLLATFLDAGIQAESPAEIRALLEQAQDMPFGSPFSGPTKVTAQYGVYSIDQFGWSGIPHLGIDLTPLTGDWAIYLPAEATLIDFGFSDIFGKYMEFETSSGYRMFFAHLETIYWQDFDGDGNWSLTVGDLLPARTRIALMGQTGRWATGPHLHYEIKRMIGNEWKTLDPAAIIGYTGAMSDDDEGGK